MYPAIHTHMLPMCGTPVFTRRRHWLFRRRTDSNDARSNLVSSVRQMVIGVEDALVHLLLKGQFVLVTLFSYFDQQTITQHTR